MTMPTNHQDIAELIERARKLYVERNSARLSQSDSNSVMRGEWDDLCEIQALFELLKAGETAALNPKEA